MLKLIVGILIVLWLFGFIGHIGGGLIHLGVGGCRGIVLVFDLLAEPTSGVAESCAETSVYVPARPVENYKAAPQFCGTAFLVCTIA